MGNLVGFSVVVVDLTFATSKEVYCLLQISQSLSFRVPMKRCYETCLHCSI